MDYGVVDKLYVAENDLIIANQKILDLKVDLSLIFAHDCPPVNYYRVVSGQRAYVRKLNVTVGDAINVGDEIALFSTEIGEAPASDSRSICKLNTTQAASDSAAPRVAHLSSRTDGAAGNLGAGITWT